LLTTSCFELLKSLEITKPPVAIVSKKFQNHKNFRTIFFTIKRKPPVFGFWEIFKRLETQVIRVTSGDGDAFSLKAPLLWPLL
jgi:hypothetical protein